MTIRPSCCVANCPVCDQIGQPWPIPKPDDLAGRFWLAVYRIKARLRILFWPWWGAYRK